MSNKQNLGYDGIKKMLNTMRTLSENTASKATLKEEEEEQKVNNLVLNNNVEIKIHSSDQEDLKVSDEEKNALNQLIENFKSQVSEMASFEEGFNIYTKSVRLDGSISEDLGFVFIAGEDRGIYINSDMLMLNDETSAIIEKLNKFQHTFEDVVNEMINTRKTN
jgi:hypothetical protein